MRASSMRKHFGGMFRILLARDSHPLCFVLKIKRPSRKHFLIHFLPRHGKYTHSHTVHTHSSCTRTHTLRLSEHTYICQTIKQLQLYLGAAIFLPLCPLPTSLPMALPAAVLCGYYCGCGWVFAFFKLCEFILFCFYFYGAWNYAYFAIFCLALKEIKKNPNRRRRQSRRLWLGLGVSAPFALAPFHRPFLFLLSSCCSRCCCCCCFWTVGKQPVACVLNAKRKLCLVFVKRFHARAFARSPFVAIVNGEI